MYSRKARTVSASSGGSALQAHYLVPEGSGRNLGHIARLSLSTMWPSHGPNSRHKSSTKNYCRSPSGFIHRTRTDPIMLFVFCLNLCERTFITALNP